MIGTKIGNYAVIKQIGEGGMGAVYAAKHTLLDKTVAVKVLLPQYSSNEEVVSRFFNEAKATTMIDHPGIVELYDFGHLEDGSAYIIMELLLGESLDDRIQKVGRMPYTEATRIIARIAGILKAAHDHDIVHRDIKPENIFLVPDPGVEERERPKVLDFGIAKLNDESNPDAVSKVKTRTGSIIGSPLYMSPEQCRGAGLVDFRSDIYSLGCILYELLCGSPPFDGEGTGEIIGAHLHVSPTDPKEIVPSIPDGLAAAVLKSLAKKPDERYQSMEEFSASLRKYSSATIGGPSRGSGGTAPWGEKAIRTPPPVSAVASTKIGTGAGDDPDLAFAPTRTPVPTTLGLSTEAGVVQAPDEKRGSKLLGILVAGSLAAAGLAYYKVSAAADSDSTTSAVDTNAVDTSAAAPPAAKVAKVPVEISEPAPTEVTLQIDSAPSGAAIHQASDDKLLGHAPLTLTRPVGDDVLDLVLRHEGHLDANLSLGLAKDAAEVVALSVLPEASPDKDTKVAGTAKNSKAAAAKARAKAKALAKAKAKATAKAKAEAKAKAAAKAKAEAKARAAAKAKAKKDPLTQPKAKTERAGDGALNPFKK